MGRNIKARLISPQELNQKKKRTKERSGRSIGSRIVLGYVQLYLLIALIAMVSGIIAWYVSAYYNIQDDIEKEIQHILERLEYTPDHEQLHANLEGMMPHWVLRYDLYIDRVSSDDEPSDNVMEKVFLFCKDGIGVTTANQFDRAQSYSPIDSLSQVNSMYGIISKTHESLYQYPEYGSRPAYILYSVSNMRSYPNGWFHYGNWAATLMITYLFVFVLGLALVIVYGAYQTRKYLLPIQDITLLASQLGTNNLNMRLDVDRAQYELKELVLTINTMLERIYITYVKQRRFVSDVSHELRTPISVIDGYANMLKRWARDDKVVFDESVEAIIEEADTMKNLVENLLFLARCDNRTLAYEMEEFNLSELIENIYRDTEITDNSKHTITSD
ncbi:MAG: hypothetical protein MJB12_09960, partial [Firmicutes bacterium]|nr:hypothetical protein [Bacillota bacterium]